MTDVTLTDMEDLKTDIDTFNSTNYPLYSDQLAVYTAAINGTGISTDDKDWANAKVTLQPGNTTGESGVDNELS